MEFLRFEDLETYEPSGHAGVVNRLLVGKANLAVQEVSVWHGLLHPGGRSDLHVHSTSLQIYVGLTGSMVVGNGQEEEELKPRATAYFQVGENHFIENRSKEDAEVLVISVPGLR
ncbi:MAG TPA: cupin domain-containing protein [Acidimicrobiia bacterium]|nr:cupin domain-containing protein [Acidimicrobiia bacterium]